VWLFVNEVPTLWTLVGGVLVIASVTLRAILELRGRGRPLDRGRSRPG
jgi:drug/metabolite transporter (DMT)-like permease